MRPLRYDPTNHTKGDHATVEHEELKRRKNARPAASKPNTPAVIAEIKRDRNTGVNGKGTLGYPRGYQDEIPTTPENRVRKGPICGQPRTGKSSSGPGICCMPAGFGTTHPGQGACKWHGGRTKSAIKQGILAQMSGHVSSTYGTPQEIDPHTAVLEEIHRTAGHVRWLGALIAALDTTDTEKPVNLLGQFTDVGIRPSLLMELYREERTHLLRACRTAVQMGVEERRVQLAEDQGRLLAAVLQAIFADRELKLTPAQRQVYPKIVRRHLEALPTAELSAPPMPANL